MEVVLTQDVANVGKKYQTVTVSDGYGRNYLIPRGLAEAATSSRAASLSQKRAASEAQQEKRAQARREALTALDGQTLTVTGKANEDGTLYKRIRGADVVGALQNAGYEYFTDKDIDIPTPISQTGAHQVTVSADNASATVTLDVQATDA